MTVREDAVPGAKRGRPAAAAAKPAPSTDEPVITEEIDEGDDSTLPAFVHKALFTGVPSADVDAALAPLPKKTPSNARVLQEAQTHAFLAARVALRAFVDKRKAVVEKCEAVQGDRDALTAKQASDVKAIKDAHSGTIFKLQQVENKLAGMCCVCVRMRMCVQVSANVSVCVSVRIHTFLCLDNGTCDTCTVEACVHVFYHVCVTMCPTQTRCCDWMRHRAS